MNVINAIKSVLDIYYYWILIRRKQMSTVSIVETHPKIN